MKKVIAFDLDDTLAISKSPLDDEMAGILVELLEHFDVCIISGGKFHQFQQQIINHLIASPTHFSKLHLMPTCGTRYYRYDALLDEWKCVYAEDLTEKEKKQIMDVLESTAREAGLWPENPYGDVIEDRNSQVSISFIGQEAPAEKKYQWAALHNEERLKVRETAAKQLTNFEVRAGGSTTIDVTRHGIDKAYGMHKLMQELEISREDITFFGDKLEPGGNDYPVKAMGIDSIDVSSWRDTARSLRAILSIIK